MSRILPVVALAGAFACTPGWAMFKCTGPDGRASFQDAPCAGSGRLVAEEMAERERAAQEARDAAVRREAMQRQRAEAERLKAEEERVNTERIIREMRAVKPSCEAQTMPLRIGMSLDELRRCTPYGQPQSVNTTVTPSGQLVQHVYRLGVAGTHYLYFRGGVLASWQFQE